MDGAAVIAALHYENIACVRAVLLRSFLRCSISDVGPYHE